MFKQCSCSWQLCAVTLAPLKHSSYSSGVFVAREGNGKEEPTEMTSTTNRLNFKHYITIRYSQPGLTTTSRRIIILNCIQEDGEHTVSVKFTLFYYKRASGYFCLCFTPSSLSPWRLFASLPSRIWSQTWERERERSAVVMRSRTVPAEIQRYSNNFKLFHYKKSNELLNNLLQLFKRP
jgi:hypothetical protein